MIVAMDTIDRKIIAELQAEGRLTVTELAQRVGLSVAPCHRRLRELERVGAIRGYRAVVDPAVLGLGFEVLVQVTMDREDAATVADFERGLAEIPEVRHAERLFGDPDYLLRVATADVDEDEATDWRLIVLEDAGELMDVAARAELGQGLSRLLNLTDGLLGQDVHALLLVTTNEPIARLHPAVRRPGRCWAAVDFVPFDAGEAAAWLALRGVHEAPGRAATLAELYAIAAGRAYEAPRQADGFGFARALSR
jgi:DNA-binding Lrp family transcriptional regulator